MESHHNTIGFDVLVQACRRPLITEYLAQVCVLRRMPSGYCASVHLHKIQNWGNLVYITIVHAPVLLNLTLWLLRCVMHENPVQRILDTRFRLCWFIKFSYDYSVESSHHHNSIFRNKKMHQQTLTWLFMIQDIWSCISTKTPLKNIYNYRHKLELVLEKQSHLRVDQSVPADKEHRDPIGGGRPCLIP
jgi:hypothetical protein